MEIDILCRYLNYVVNLSNKEFLAASYRVKEAIIHLLGVQWCLLDVPEWESDSLLSALKWKLEELYSAIYAKYLQGTGVSSVQEMCADYSLLFDLGSVKGAGYSSFVDVDSCLPYKLSFLQKIIIDRALKDKRQGMQIITTSQTVRFFSQYIYDSATPREFGKQLSFEKVKNTFFYGDIVNWVEQQMKQIYRLSLYEQMELSYSIEQFTSIFKELQMFGHYDRFNEQLWMHFEELLADVNVSELSDSLLDDYAMPAWYYGAGSAMQETQDIDRLFYFPMAQRVFCSDELRLDDRFIAQAYLLSRFAKRYTCERMRCVG